ncbi:hypothetical protein C8R45DRAFT_942175 [Mycena sanguinolenta]|nr:hypothetical protein C8R45DRAFT_942175 [Mycena sanguinolenta]
MRDWVQERKTNLPIRQDLNQTWTASTLTSVRLLAGEIWTRSAWQHEVPNSNSELSSSTSTSRTTPARRVLLVLTTRVDMWLGFGLVLADDDNGDEEERKKMINCLGDAYVQAASTSAPNPPHYVLSPLLGEISYGSRCRLKLPLSDVFKPQLGHRRQKGGKKGVNKQHRLFDGQWTDGTRIRQDVAKKLDPDPDRDSEECKACKVERRQSRDEITAATKHSSQTTRRGETPQGSRVFDFFDTIAIFPVGKIARLKARLRARQGTSDRPAIGEAVIAVLHEARWRRNERRYVIFP